jgi:hypothetical protein
MQPTASVSSVKIEVCGAVGDPAAGTRRSWCFSPVG